MRKQLKCIKLLLRNTRKNDCIVQDGFVRRICDVLLPITYSASFMNDACQISKSGVPLIPAFPSEVGLTKDSTYWSKIKNQVSAGTQHTRRF